MSNRTSIDPPDEHSLTWGERLQDRLDGDLSPADCRSVDAHLADCTACQAQLAEFEALDRALLAAAPPLSLDAAFDRRLLSRIDAIDDQQRIRARQQLEEEMQANLRALSRWWRQSLAFVIPGVLAGMALTFALIRCLDQSGLGRALIQEGAIELGRNSALYVQALIIVVVGSGIGLTLARWLSSAGD